MPSARYRFVRDNNNVAGKMSSQRPSTDAINALGTWAHALPGRSFAEVWDDDESVVADLTWNSADQDAGPSLESACIRVGIERAHVEFGKVVKVGTRNGVVVIQYSGDAYAAFKPMHPPDPTLGAELQWSSRGEPGFGRTTVTSASDGYLWHVDKARFELPRELALALAD